MRFAVMAALLTGATASAGERGWNPEAAARYLDDRMDVWFAKAKKLKTGEGETVCVSCHTSVPYALARPALRKSMRVGAATALEARLREEVARRVEAFDADQPLYDFDESKKLESRGTEAVLNALILASADADERRGQPSEPTRKALRQLWATQRPDGAWQWLDFGLEPFESNEATYYGASLAALAAGTAPAAASDDARGLDKLRGYLKERYEKQSLYNRTWALLASTRLKGVVTKAQRVALVAELERAQAGDGGWALVSLAPWTWSKPNAPFRPPGATDGSLLRRSDGYATGLAVYALRQAGTSTRHPAVQQGLRWLEANQQAIVAGQSAWRAHSLNFDREHGGDKGEPWRRMFMSDAATAFAVLALSASE